MLLSLVCGNTLAVQVDLEKVALLFVTSKRDTGFFFTSGEFVEVLLPGSTAESCMWARTFEHVAILNSSKYNISSVVETEQTQLRH